MGHVSLVPDVSDKEDKAAPVKRLRCGGVQTQASWREVIDFSSEKRKGVHLTERCTLAAYFLGATINSRYVQLKRFPSQLIKKTA
ncbi:hypothetical protein EI42_00626 [Thermosporothrix hazakensis]|jgi:hypothetical protein|uniref:Uncharacterized protein n=2 Tax=Thermosporothrix TaxID=768650 RepID=A0A326UCX1_THEHA|nr:hypothetical protein EI42_00626 [Thermosporothrix hazakensis]BBH88920.1 hypothetical protein KTC_36710 [Thermosporothrix sp. COM3]GCE47106.1 hypothetical protein KTH_19750 [Thermosporothrix hazakensis]